MTTPVETPVEHKLHFLALPAEDLPLVRFDASSLSTEELKVKCNEYFALLDELNPPECLLADYEAACDELRQRLTAPSTSLKTV
ncbi:hypothetical protein GCM10027404_10850 [Arthrobacter tumbae]